MLRFQHPVRRLEMTPSFVWICSKWFDIWIIGSCEKNNVLCSCSVIAPCVTEYSRSSTYPVVYGACPNWPLKFFCKSTANTPTILQKARTQKHTQQSNLIMNECEKNPMDDNGYCYECGQVNGYSLMLLDVIR